MTAEHPLTRANRLALQAVARGAYWNAVPRLFDLINRGYVEDRGPSFGGAPERFVLTDKGRDELAGRGWVA